MSLYLRYFDKEAFVHSIDEAINFLRSEVDIKIDAELEADIRGYAASDVYYPKRYKVRPRVYFIIIKTTAATMMDFKQKKALRPNIPTVPEMSVKEFAIPTLTHLTEQRPGWYEGAFDFKRVVTIFATGKHEYRDTHIVVRCKANSGQDCYDRIIEYLRGRVDNRSQFPSAKGKNFSFQYLGMWK